MKKPQTRPLVIAGNWKMNKTIVETVAFIKELLPQIKGTETCVLLAPPFTAISAASMAAGGNVSVGAQNMSDAEEGAFTGEISSKMVKDAGGEFVVLGHSERRQLFNESDELIHFKLKRALLDELTPVFCVGETGLEREAGKSEKVIGRQLDAALGSLTSLEVEQMMIAYEPVWAIGTGMAATPELAEEVHAWIRSYLEANWSHEVAETVPLLYGGSVKPNNIDALIKKPNIDGALIGGASLDVDAFAKMIHAGDAK